MATFGKMNSSVCNLDINQIQIKLNAIRGMYHCPWDYLNPDGILGPKTGSAIKSFKVYRNIQPTNEQLDNNTRNQINQLYQSVPKLLSANSLGITPEVKPGQSHLKDIIEGTGLSAETASLLLHPDLPWMKYLLDAVPDICYSINHSGREPLYLLLNDDIYKRWKSIYFEGPLGRFVEGLGNFSFIIDLFFLKDKIEEYKSQPYSPSRFTAFWAEMITYLGGTIDLTRSVFPYVYKFTTQRAAFAVSASGTVPAASASPVQVIIFHRQLLLNQGSGRIIQIRRLQGHGKGNQLHFPRA